MTQKEQCDEDVGMAEEGGEASGSGSESGGDEEEAAKRAEEEESRLRRKKLLEDQQRLANCLQQERLVDALMVALDLAQPLQCLRIVGRILDSAGEDDHDTLLSSCFAQLSRAQLSTLLDYVAQWNVNTKTYRIAQVLLSYALKCVPMEELLRVPRIDELVKALLPYTNRHYERLAALKTNASHLGYVFSRMRLGG